MTEEQTLVLIKPDGVARGLIGQIITRIEQRGYNIKQLQMLTATSAQLQQHYADKLDKPYFPALVDYMTSGPLVAMVLEGTEVVQAFRSMAGTTNPIEALPGTIRGDLGRAWDSGAVQNIVHSSDSAAHAATEIKIWFN